MSGASAMVLGAGGQVGRALREATVPEGLRPTFLERRDLDVTDRRAVAEAFATLRPEVIINLAAYTDVDGAETAPAAAFAVNRGGPAVLAEACVDGGAALIHLSTDFVFDGQGRRPYRENDPVAPLGVYGESKAQGEAAVRDRLDRHLILRTGWVFGPHGRNFLKAILRLAKERDELRVVDDQVGAPTETAALADALFALALRTVSGTTAWGTFHFSGTPAVSRHGFAAAILRAAKPYLPQLPRLAPIASEDYPAPARRPGHAVLDCARLGRVFGIRQPDWQTGLTATVRRVVEGGI